MNAQTASTAGPPAGLFSDLPVPEQDHRTRAGQENLRSTPILQPSSRLASTPDLVACAGIEHTLLHRCMRALGRSHWTTRAIAHRLARQLPLQPLVPSLGADSDSRSYSRVKDRYQSPTTEWTSPARACSASTLDAEQFPLKVSPISPNAVTYVPGLLTLLEGWAKVRLLC